MLCHVQMLYSSASPVFIKENPGLSNQCVGRIVFGGIQGKIRIGVAKVDSPNASFSQGAQHVFAGGVLCPDAKLAEDRVVLVNPAISVRIVGPQVCEPIPALGAEQLAAVVDDAVSVLIQR